MAESKLTIFEALSNVKADVGAVGKSSASQLDITWSARRRSSPSRYRARNVSSAL